MKKKFEQKLSLNKTTVVKLENREMDDANGGIFVRFSTDCNTHDCVITTSNLWSLCHICIDTNIKITRDLPCY
ncbi:MAG: hypothetical protein GY765_06225 [bacterium]|nr:hypothetical protein [bacterium]